MDPAGKPFFARNASTPPSKQKQRGFSLNGLVPNVWGLSGTGKTSAIRRWLPYYGSLIIYDQFPYLVGPFQQVPCLTLDVPHPGTGRSFMLAFMEACAAAIPEPNDMRMLLDETIGKGKTIHPDSAFQKVMAWINSHGLGILHIDEVQNFFKQLTLRERQKDDPSRDKLRIVEDKLLQMILGMANDKRFVLVLSGTPDGMSMLCKRFANAQRLAQFGSHALNPFVDPADPDFSEVHLRYLLKYQYIANPISFSPELAELLIRRSGGIQRNVNALWANAQFRALNRNEETFTLEDIQVAPTEYAVPIETPINALRSGDKTLMAQFEDMLPATAAGTRTNAMWEGV